MEGTNMKRRFYAIASLVAMFSMVLAPAAMAQPATGGLTSDVTGTVTDADTGEVVGDFIGDLSITGIVRDGRQLVFDGVLNGVVEDADGNIVESIVDEEVQFAGDLTRAGGEQGNRCDILFLDLGPINLELLGLVVDLSDVQLDVYAVPGAGNLLGNLLCAVAGLLDGPGLGGGILNAVDRLLDRVTGILDGLLG
jgi:hypothetical protein